MSDTDSFDLGAIQWADAPFDHKTGDIILRSSDNIHFRLHKGVLVNASPIFDDLFANAQPSSSAGLKTGDEEVDGFPVIVMEEKSQVLDCLLRLYHEPFVLQPMKTDNLVEDICHLILAARKFFMNYAMTKAEELFADICKQKTFVVTAYAVACRKNMRQEVRTAAKASLYHTLDFLPNEALDHISASDIYRLHRYRKKCSDVVNTKVISRSTDDSHGWDFEWCTMRREFYGMGCYHPLWTPLGPGSHYGVQISQEVHEYLKSVSSVLRERPHPQIIYDSKRHDQLRRAGYAASSDDHMPPELWVPGLWKMDIEAFEREFAGAIDSAVSQVDIETV
ncbi:hypothetical protein BC629DRAFT_1547353 [Irpex lacteus]|nr:hypothetical protein BC629DRAFT_1547353 [Irpex lacteus]